jgi:hypothetical protein
MAEPNRLTGCLSGPCNNENIVSKPVIFLGGTVLSFNASLGIGPTQESTLSVDIINDCQTSGYEGWTSYNNPQGDYFYGYPKIGSPVFFSVCEAMKGDNDECEPNCFEFGGILTNYTATQSSSGRTFNAKVVDPRSVLDTAILIVGNYIEGPIKHRNYFNVYAYYEKGVLPKSQQEAEPTGLLLINSPGYPNLDQPVIVSGSSDCSVFGKANVDDGGMSYRKVLQALKEIKPLIYIGNYGQSYNPPLGGRDLAINIAEEPAPGEEKELHENNVLQLDITGFPEDVPQYYRVAGPSVSILELLTNVCDVIGHEFIVTLEKNSNFPAAPHIIKIQTKKIDDNQLDPSIRDNILYYDGKSTEFSYGKELRLDKNRTILIGEQEHFMFESSIVDFYFGEDKNGNPIVPLTQEVIDTIYPEYSGCGFVVPIEVDELSSSLQCPLWDYRQPGTLLDRKVLITEEDIRCSLSSEQLWKNRVLSSGIVGDFNKVIRYNFPDQTNELIRENLIKFTQIGNTVSDYASNPSASGSGDFVRPLAGRAFADAMQSANDRYSIANRYNQASALEKVHDFISNIGRTYYGRQYLASLNTDDKSVLNVCALPADFYDENYFGLGTGIYDPGAGTTISGCDGQDIQIPAGSVYRDTIYSHIPTNAGGWVDPCTKVLGINNDGYKYVGKDYPEASLSFFRTEDDRIGPFARFDTKELYVKYKAKFVEPSGSIDDQKDEFVLQEEIKSIEGDYVANACGVVDISLFNFDEYLIVRPSGGYCEDPESKQNKQKEWDGPANTGIIETREDDIITWVKAQVEEKIYIIKASGDACCSGCPPTSGCNIPKAIIKFNNPILKRSCGDTTDFADTILFTAQALNISSQIINSTGTGVIISGGIEAIKPSRSICGIPTESGLAVIQQAQAASDSANSNSYGYYPAADRPSRVAIPLKSNITTYGPWYSSNFNSHAGGINFEQDTDLAPWNYGNSVLLESVAQKLAKTSESNAAEFETGSVTYPYWPELKLGFLQNGPNLTNISVVYGSNGVSTNYTWQTYTPKFGKLQNLENQHLKEAYKNRLKAQKILRQQKLDRDKDNAKVKPGAGGSISSQPDTALKIDTRNEASQNRVLFGEMYDFGIIRDSSGVIKDFTQRTVVGTETLNKMVLDLRYDYGQKAFMSLDGLFSPVSVSGGSQDPDPKSYVLPRFAAYSPKFSGSAKCCSLAPVPPFKIELLKPNDTGVISTGVLNLDISRNFLNPLTNPFGPSGHYHAGSGVGHCIDIVGRDEYRDGGNNIINWREGKGAKNKAYVPGKGVMNSFYGQTEWDRRYSADYRFLGLKGPLVLHSWGYDTQGKPIPNAVDEYNKIMESGYFEPSGLKDEFYEDWLQKPATWPVAPVDLRFDRERGVWVSPPQHKIVVAKTSTNIEPYGTGSGILIDDRYGYSVYDASGNLIDTSEAGDAIIEIEDRIGSSWSRDQKAYAYFDSFTSKYLLLAGGGGGSSIKIGRFMNQWPSIGHVKDPYNAIKEVHLYGPRASGCPPIAVEDFQDKDFCPWVLEPKTKLENGIRVPDTVKAINLFSNVAAGEYQAKWCMIVEIDQYYYLLAAEC